MKKIRNYFLFFTAYSVIGWLYEVFLEVVVYRWGFSNRGVLFGPYCVIYGFGALLLLNTAGRLKGKNIHIGRLNLAPAAVFVLSGIVATGAELLGSYIAELLTGGWQWDYRGYALNFQGRIALNPSLRFALGGMLFIYVVQPLFDRAASKISDRALNAAAALLAAVMAADAVCTVVFKIMG